MTTEVLSTSAVVVGATAADPTAAIDIVGSILVAEGCVTPDYVAQMRQREAIMSTYLGNGIALPHGTDEARSAVLRTGLAVAQFPAGVPWGEERAYLVIGLAATSEEHIEVLSRLATILGDEALTKRLGSSLDAAEIHRTLTSDEAEAPSGNGHAVQSDELATEVRVTNPAGLHARPATTVVDRLRAFDAEIVIEANGRRANARSITALLGLGAAVGDDVRVVARGAQAEAAAAAVIAVLTGRDGD
ncbi:MAG TPA: HPr family phosphocarrier protein [Candidatus Eisenbacteria bacterium]|nr:HPr family phosphocarrier protein [Candidatus Eisenbacteria bacterium]